MTGERKLRQGRQKTWSAYSTILHDEEGKTGGFGDPWIQPHSTPWKLGGSGTLGEPEDLSLTVAQGLSKDRWLYSPHCSVLCTRSLGHSRCSVNPVNVCVTGGRLEENVCSLLPGCGLPELGDHDRLLPAGVRSSKPGPGMKMPGTAQLSEGWPRSPRAASCSPGSSSLGLVRPSKPSSEFSLPGLKLEKALFAVFLQHLSPISKKVKIACNYNTFRS